MAQHDPAPMDQPTSGADRAKGELDLVALLNAAWRGKLIIALCAALGVAVGWYEASSVAVPMYRATAQMALQVRQEQVVNLDAAFAGVSGDQHSMNTEMEVIRSRELIARLVEALDLDADPEFNPILAEERPMSLTAMPKAAALWLLVTLPEALGAGRPSDAAPLSEAEIYRQVVTNVRRSIAARVSDDSFTFAISATTQSREKSALIANTLAEIYREDQILLKVAATEEAAAWLSERAAELAFELEQRQSAAADLRSRNALFSAEGLEAVNAQAVELRQALQTAQSVARRAVERRDAIVATLDRDIVARADAAADPQLVAILAAFQDGDAGARARFDRRFDLVRGQAEADARRAGDEVAILEAALADLSRQFEAQSTDLVELQQLEREAEATRLLYETFLTRLKETSVQQGVQQADSRILSEATPGTQVAPRKARIVAVAMLIGLFVGLAYVLTREFLQNTYRSAEDLEADTGLTVLGKVPLIKPERPKGEVAYLRDKPRSAAAEAIRDLRTSILLSNIDRAPQIIMLTSSVPGEGKTTLSMALAQNLAGLEKRVLLVEGDIRRRSFETYLDMPAAAPGLLAVMARQTPLAEAVMVRDEIGIEVLIAEPSTVNAADLFSSDRFAELLGEMREAYDYIIIDTPPVLIVPDARVIAQACDTVVYVVNWDATSTAQVAEGLRLLRSVNVPVSGLVLSKIDPKRLRKYGFGGQFGASSSMAREYYEA